MTIRVMLADDHQIILDALSLLLENEGDINVVGTANDGRTVLDLAEILQPDVVVMDISMPGMNGIEATRRMVAKYPKIKVVALSGFAYKQHVMEMLEAGASAYLVKGNSGGELVRALHSVMKGHKFLCQEIAAIAIECTRHIHNAGGQQLGLREREVLQLLAEGDTSPIIAKRLFISTSTVDVHRRNIMKKLDLHSIAELTKYAVRNGLTTE